MKDHPIPVREAIDLAGSDLLTDSDFFGRPGKPTRELASAACLCMAILKEMADKVSLRLCQPDPPDIEIEWPDRVELLEVVTLNAKGKEPHGDAKRLERFCKEVGEALTQEAREESIRKYLLGPIQCLTSDKHRENTESLFEGKEIQVNTPTTLQRELQGVLEEAKKQLLKKAKKYAAKGESLRFGLLIHSLINSNRSPFDADLWTNWLSPEERLAAEIFPDIYFLQSNSIRHRALILRKGNTWLEPADFHCYRDPIQEAQF